MPEVELARRPDVELVKTGSWATMTGSWNPTPEDLASAVEAQSCPAIRRPIVKLGHTDKRFDGEPAMGWFENLRLADNGATLVGDQVTLPWLHGVQAAAYPSRSVEGNYNHTCSEGHKHKFVLTAVALLGVTPPAVQTIRNLHDLPAALGVAASEQAVPDGAEHVQVTIQAAAEVHTGAMVALIPTDEDAARLAVEGGEPADQLHVTLAYLGDAADLGAQGQQDVIDGVSTAANGLPQFDAEAFALNVFNPPGAQRDDGKDRDSCIVLGLSGVPIDAVHDLIEAALREALWSVPTPAPHRPWHAHMTLEYTEDLSKLAGLVDRIGPIRFDRIRIAFGGQHIDIPLIAGEDDEAVAASAADSIRVRIAPIEARIATREPTDVVAKFHPGQKRDNDGQWTDGSPGSDDMPAGPARKVRLRDEDGKAFHLEFNDGAMQLRIPYDGDETDDPDRDVSDHFDTLQLDRDSTAEFAEELEIIADTRDGYVRDAKVKLARLNKMYEAGDTDTAEYRQVQDAWFDIGGDGQRIAGGELPGKTGTLVYEMRMGDEATDTSFLIALRPPDAPDDWDLQDAAGSQAGGFLKMAAFKRLKKEVDGASKVTASAKSAAVVDPAPQILPAAEPEPEIITDPKEDLVSTDLSAFRSRLGLDDTADEQAITAAIDALKVKAETPAQPTPEMVAASAAAESEKDELRKEVTVLASQVKTMSDELSTTKAAQAATVKASVFDAAVKDGKLKPADREQWEKDYDEAPGAITRVLASIAPGTAVPVMASGTTGTPEPAGSDSEWDEIVSRLDAPKAV